MDFYNLILGVIFLLVGIILILIDNRTRTKEDKWLTYGNVNYKFGILFAIGAGVIYIISAF